MATYNAIYPNSITTGDGLISALSILNSIPWNALDPAAIADIERAYGVRSGFKTITSGFLLADTSARARILATLFGQKWTKLWKDFTLEYNPLDAYRVEETYKGQKKVDDTHTDTFGRKVVNSGTDKGTVTTEGIDNADGSNGIYGFNSTQSVPAATSTEQLTSKDTETRNLEDSRTIENSGSDSRTIDGQETSEHTLTKAGNIGYSTPQKLLREDIELWINPFFNIVFDDIDSFITMQVYDLD